MAATNQDSTEPTKIDPAHELPTEPEAEGVAAAGDEVQRLREECDALQNRLLRALAEADNTRKRAQREIQEARLYATAEAVKPFLPVLDGFELALKHAGSGEGNGSQGIRKGLEMLHRQFLDAARKLGVEPVEALDHPFDPHVHQAIEMVETPAVPEGTVVEELQRGYKLKDRLLRPAMVKVARGGRTS